MLHVLNRPLLTLINSYYKKQNMITNINRYEPLLTIINHHYNVRPPR